MNNTMFVDATALELDADAKKFLITFNEHVERFNAGLEDISRKSCDPQKREELLERTKSVIVGMLNRCREFDLLFHDSPLLIAKARQEFQERTNTLFRQSFFMTRARTWPQGYPGDYKTLEYTYGNAPMSEGIGYLLDRYFLSTTLAVAVRSRLRKLCELLKREIVSRPRPTILNVACGSCRELFDVAPEIIQSGASATCIDFDKDALQFSSDRLSCSGIPTGKISFSRYNAVKMVNRNRNLSEFGLRDIIYSTGFYDYMSDEVLVPLFDASYDLLAPGGVLIASFKDSRKYQTQDYHWLVKWDSFLQRTEEETDAIFARTVIPPDSIKKQREETGVIHFYSVTKPS